MTKMNVKKLIYLVHSQPALWDPKHDDYNNKVHLKQLWEEIGEQMECTAEGCKIKWRSLRDVYRRELKKYQCRLNDPNAADKSAPKWFCFKELQFLTEHLSGFENITEYAQESSDDYFESLYVKSEGELLDEEEITLKADEDLLLALTDSKTQNADSSVKSDYCFQIADTNQLDESESDRVGKSRDASKRSSGYLSEQRGRKRAKVMERSDPDADGDYHFLMSLLPFLRMIPQHRKMHVRTKIQNVFCEEMDVENYDS